MQGRPPTEGFLSPAGGDRSRYDPLQGRALAWLPPPVTGSRVHVFPRAGRGRPVPLSSPTTLQAPATTCRRPSPPLALTASSSYFSPVFFLPA